MGTVSEPQSGQLAEKEVLKSGSNKTIALIIITVACFFRSFMSSSINVAIPSISQDFHADTVSLGWIVTAYALSTAMFLIPFGKLADIVGIKKIFVYGLIVYTLASFFSAISTSATMLIGLRIIHGIAVAMVIGNSFALLTALYPAKDRGRVFGITLGAVYAGASCGPFLGGVLTEHLGWRSLFWINVPASIVILVLLLWKIKDEFAEARGEKFDIIGSIVYGFTILLIMYGFTVLPATQGMILILLGGAGIYIFVKWENKIKYPVLDIRLFKNNKLFVYSNIAAFINYCGTFAFVVLLSLYLQYIKGYSPEKAGLILLVEPIIQAVFSPIMGRLSDKLEPRIVATVGMALNMLGLGLFILLSEQTSDLIIIFLLILIGLGFALFVSPNTNIIMGSVQPKFYGVASATTNTMRTVGQALSMAITAMILVLTMGNVVITPEYYPQLLIATRFAFGIFASLCLIGTFLSIFRARTIN